MSTFCLSKLSRIVAATTDPVVLGRSHRSSNTSRYIGFVGQQSQAGEGTRTAPPVPQTWFRRQSVQNEESPRDIVENSHGLSRP